MEDFAAGMDAGVLDAEFVDSTPTDGAESTALATTDGAEPAIGGDPTDGDQTALVPAGGPVALTSGPGQLSESGRRAIEAVRAADPGAATALQKTVHHMDQIRREFPGGMKELRALKERAEAAESLGPFEETRRELAGFREYDRQFMAGDPKFVETMISAEPNAFQKLAPMIFSKFAELNPEGYRALTAKATMTDMLEARLPSQLELMTVLLNEIGPPLAAANVPVGAFNRLVDVFNAGPLAFISKLDAESKKQIVAPTTTPKTEDLSLQQREMKLTRQEWGADTRKPMQDIFRAELAKLAPGKKHSDTELRNIVQLFGMRLQQELGKIPDYESKSNQYLQAKDREGYGRYQLSQFRQIAPKALRAIIGRPAPAKTPAPGAAAAGITPTQTPQANNGFLFVGSIPKPQEIDAVRSSGLIEKNRAILKDGRKVQWR